MGYRASRPGLKLSEAGTRIYSSQRQTMKHMRTELIESDRRASLHNIGKRALRYESRKGRCPLHLPRAATNTGRSVSMRIDTPWSCNDSFREDMGRGEEPHMRSSKLPVQPHDRRATSFEATTAKQHGQSESDALNARTGTTTRRRCGWVLPKPATVSLWGNQGRLRGVRVARRVRWRQFRSSPLVVGQVLGAGV